MRSMRTLKCSTANGKTDGTAAHYFKWSKLDTERKTQRVLTDGNLTKQTSTQNRHQEKLGSVGERENGCGAAGLVHTQLVHTQGVCVELYNLRWPVGYANRDLKLWKRDVIQIPSNAYATSLFFLFIVVRTLKMRSTVFKKKCNLISSSIIYFLLKIKILFPFICKFLKGRKSILYSNQSTQTSVYMLPSYCVSFQAWSFQSTQESLRRTTAFSSNQSKSVERSHSNCTPLADPWWQVWKISPTPQSRKNVSQNSRHT